MPGVHMQHALSGCLENKRRETPKKRSRDGTDRKADGEDVETVRSQGKQGASQAKNGNPAPSASNGEPARRQWRLLQARTHDGDRDGYDRSTQQHKSNQG